MSTTSGCTSTAPTDSPPRSRRSHARASRASSGPTPSSSIPTSGCSRPDSCALLYRDPEIARLAHTQHAEYLDALTESTEWNPSDYSVQLTRRARGLPLWFSLATFGADVYREAIAVSIELAHAAGREIAARDYLALVRDPQLSVVVFERVGWSPGDYAHWSNRLLDDQKAFVVPSSHAGRTNARFAIVNPRTTLDDLIAILDSMR